MDILAPGTCVEATRPFGGSHCNLGKIIKLSWEDMYTVLFACGDHGNRATEELTVVDPEEYERRICLMNAIWVISDE